MKNIVTRSISGTVYVAVIIAATIAGGYWFFALTGILAMIGALEYQRIAAQAARHYIPAGIRLADFAATILLWALAPIYVYTLNRYPEMREEALLAISITGLTVLTVYIVLRMCMSLYDRNGDAFGATARSFLGVIYIGVPVAILNILAIHCGYAVLLLMFAMIWLNDTGAYLVGSALGKHRLCPRLSPKKSWEGFWGGMAFCIIAGIVYAMFIAHDSVLVWAAFGVIVSITATAGDLFESMMKRAADVKDSGNIIPGHGGILDRIDSLLLVAPVTALFVFVLFVAQTL